MSYESELLALAALLYLYDSSALLYANEAILTCDHAHSWSANTGWIGFVFAGRTLCVLNPFTPHRAAFRLNWDFQTLHSGCDESSRPERDQELNKLAPFSVTAWLALFIVLPLGMFTGVGSYAIVPALALLYGSILLGLLQLSRNGNLAALNRKQFWGIVFECITCPPFGANMVRHISLKKRIVEPLPLAAARLLNAARWKTLCDLCILRIEDAIQLEGENPTARKSLEAQQQRLRELQSTV